MKDASCRILVFAMLLNVPSFAQQTPTDPPIDVKQFEGLWAGSWGGGERDGVVFQPVLAEMVIHGNNVELSGFRTVGRLSGTIRINASARKFIITPNVPKSGSPVPRDVEYSFEIRGDKLTLNDSESIPTYLHKQRVEQNPLANIRLELVSSEGINDKGELLITEFTVLQVGRQGATYFQADNRVLKTIDAAVLQVQDATVRRITAEEARGLIRKSTPVVVAYRPVAESRLSNHELWRNVGLISPDSDVAWQTYLRVLRPGTLIFVLSAHANVPEP